MVTFDVPDIVVEVSLGPEPDERRATTVTAVRSALPDAPDEIVRHLAAVGAEAVRRLLDADPLYAGVVLARVGTIPDRLATSLILVSARPRAAVVRPDPTLALHLLRQRFGDENVEPLPTPLGPGFVVVSDQHYRAEVGPLGEPGDHGGVVRTVQVHVPLPGRSTDLILAVGSAFPADIDLHTGLLATMLRSLRLTTDDARPSTIRSVLDGDAPRRCGRTS